MTTVDYSSIQELLATIHAQGRTSLYEHECYRLQTLIGAEAAPENRLIPIGSHPRPADLNAIPTSKVVLKVVSPDITHKTEARGVRIVANERGAVDAAFELMLREVPETYAAYLENHEGEIPPALIGLRRDGLEQRLAKRIEGILLCGFAESDANGLATELFVGIRTSSEFGPIISAGLGGVEMEILARQTREGSAVVIAPTATVDGGRFLDLFKGTLSYQRLSGVMRGSGRLVEDAILEECFQAYIDLANYFSELNPESSFHIVEMEVNPYTVVGGRLAPLDGVCAFRPAAEPRSCRPLDKIGSLLQPESIAVIGASENSVNMGRIILRNVQAAGFPEDRIYVIRPDAETLDGVRCVASIADLPEKVDLVVVAIGAHQIPAVAAELIETDRANSVILIPGGLGEKEGSQALESRLRDQIRAAHERDDGGPVFLGGNSMGVVSHPGQYDTTFIPDIKLPRSRGDRVRQGCFISQSGAFIISNTSRFPSFDPAYALSIGNQIDLTVGDLVSYLADDPSIEVMAVYMEGFRPGDGLVFARAVRDAVSRGKDVVFYKAGRTEEGRSATAGHTASVAGDYAICAAALHQAGAFVASSFDEYSDLVRLCFALRGKQASGNRLAAISNAGFEAVGMADSIRQQGSELRLAEFSRNTNNSLSETLARHRLDALVDVKNPLDLTPMAADEVYAQVIEHVLEDDEVDVAVVGVVPLTPALQTLPAGQGHDESILSEDSVARALATVAASSDKPVVAVVDSGRLFDPLADQLAGGGVPVFRAADRAVRSLCSWVDLKLQNRRLVGG
jgi:acyl-CoA synthetase (NDP forming)